MHRLFLTTIACLMFFSVVMTGQTKPATDPLIQEMAGQIAYAGDKWVKLLEATPDDKLDWRPEKGVRSIRELYTHIADANIFFMSFVGVEAPPGSCTSQGSVGTRESLCDEAGSRQACEMVL